MGVFVRCLLRLVLVFLVFPAAAHCCPGNIAGAESRDTVIPTNAGIRLDSACNHRATRNMDPGTAEGRLDPAHAVWEQLLQRHVRWTSDGSASQTDYAGFAAERDQLRRYLQQLAIVTARQFADWPEPARQAFLINTYNAATVELIQQRWPRLESIRELGGWLRTPWQRPFVELLGETRSLDDIEHVLLRGAPGFAEPRIHFAVNCASVGCPALHPEAYAADRLHAQLDDQTQRFLRDRSRNRFDRERQRLQVSRIFNWYSEDFAGVGGIAGFLADHGAALDLDAQETEAVRRGDIGIEFLAYDWSLNRSRP